MYGCRERGSFFKVELVNVAFNAVGFVICSFCDQTCIHDLSFDTELVSKIVLGLKRGKAADIDGLCTTTTTTICGDTCPLSCVKC